ncbi:hypothetical protein ACIA03_25240 [Nocardioides sp. NPDC051685]|uniref:hypothetical protein n=1 Tax=Nocardioides sp. NPDC051685 TaxID=3364334 RepID=UPI00378DF52F
MTTTTDIDSPHTESPHGKSVLRDLGPLHKELRRAIPDVYKGWGELSKAAFADGALDAFREFVDALDAGEPPA